MLEAARQPAIGSSLLFYGTGFFLAAIALVYFRGFRRIRRSRPKLFPDWRFYCFLAGIGALWIALASWLDLLSSFLLTAHMAQHMILMLVVPPLLLLGAPAVPLLRGLPRSLVRDGLGPLFRSRTLRRVAHFITLPIFAWLIMNLSFLGWHFPQAYELALHRPGWHIAEHACFLTASMLFWFPVIQPWPSVSRGSRWWLLPYLVTADIVNTLLAAFLSFSRHPIYPTYASASLLLGISPVNDQSAAGALMWVIGSIFYLVPAVAIVMRLLSPSHRRSLT